MVIKLLLTWHLWYFSKTHIIKICLFEGKYNMNKIFTQLGDIGNTFTAIIHAYHTFQRYSFYRTYGVVLIDKVIEQRKCVLALTCEEIGQMSFF